MKKEVRVCQGRYCTDNGSKRVYKAIKKYFGLKFASKNDSINLSYCHCLGYCERGVNVAVDRNMIYQAKPGTIGKAIEEGGEKKPKPIGKLYITDDFLKRFLIWMINKLPMNLVQNMSLLALVQLGIFGK